MKKSTYIFLIIITFGIFYFYVRNKAKKTSEVNTKLKYSNVSTFDINELIQKLGDKTNIISSSFTLSTLKIKVKDIKLINKEEFKNFKFKGLMINNDIVIIICGDNAKMLSEQINQFIV
jgi:phosphotransferase system IIB component